MDIVDKKILEEYSKMLCRGKLPVDFGVILYEDIVEAGVIKVDTNSYTSIEFIPARSEDNWYWGWGGLSINPAITPEFVIAHSEKPWEWGKWGLSGNSAITPEFVMKNLDKDWDWGCEGLSSNTMYIGIERERRKRQIRDFKTYSPFMPDITNMIASFL